MAEATAAHRAAVLVVDDEPHIRQVCSEALRNAGHEVTVAEDGETAASAIGAQPFDAAVLDIVLPDTDGLALLQEVRAHNPDAIIVLITGFASLDTALEAVRLGAYEYLRKPFAASDLVRILGRGLQEAQLRDRNTRLVGELRQANLELLDRQAHLEERVRMASDELTAFVDLGSRLHEGQELPQALHDILRAGMQVTHARAAAAYKAEEWPGRLRGMAAVGLSERDVLEAEIGSGQGMVGAVAADGQARIENDLLAGALADDPHLAYLGVRSALVCPLVWSDELHGVMAIFDHETTGFTEQSLNLLGVLAGQAARIVAALPAPEPAAPPKADSDDFVDLSELL